MKKYLFAITAFTIMIITACNNKKAAEENNMVNMDTTKVTTVDTTPVTEVMPRFTSIDPSLAASLKTIFDHYLHIKNALVNNDGGDASSGAKEMTGAISHVDKSLFTAEQKKLYDNIEDDLKEHAEHIGKNGGDLEHQRDHFSMMSEDMYDLVKVFGGGQALYHDHCPMANDNKGAMWLSEMREVRNPYFGGKMNECVKVVEVIK